MDARIATNGLLDRIGRWRRSLQPGIALVALGIAHAVLAPSAIAQTASDLGLGGFFSCAVLTNGSVQCWGRNDSGNLGDGSTIDFSSSPRLVSGITNAVDVEAGNFHACALLSGGEVRCWGGNGNRQVGVSSPTPVRSPVSVPLPAVATSIGVGGFSTCALLDDGRVFCWGRSLLGELGDGTRIVSQFVRIVQVQGITDATAITVGTQHACAVLADGTTMCWGANQVLQLGVAADAVEDCEGTPCSASPVIVPGVTATAVSAATNHTCSIHLDQTVGCWGFWAGLGDGSTTGSSPPSQVSGPLSATELAAGSTHQCAIAPDGEVHCWGWNGFGQIGDGYFVCNSCTSPTPVTIPSLSGSVLSVAAGLDHTCAIRTDGSVSCWGANGFGQLGDGTTIDSSTPVTVLDPGTIQSLSIVPTSATVGVGIGQVFQASGGTPPYTFSIATNASGGAISATTGAYTAGAVGSVTDIVRVTDQAGSSADATVNVTPPPADNDADGLDDAFEAGFIGAGITIFSPSASPPHTASSTGDAFSGSTISASDLTVILPAGTTAETPTTEISIRYRDNSPGPGVNPSAEVSGVSLPPGMTKSIQMPFGDQTAVCIDDSAAATLETVEALGGNCDPPRVEIDIPIQLGTTNTSGPYALTRVSATAIRVDGLTHTAVIAIPSSFTRLRWWLIRFLTAVLVIGLTIVVFRLWKGRRMTGSDL